MSYKSTTEASAAPSGAIAARELFGNLLAAEGSPRLIDAWNALHATQQQGGEQEAREFMAQELEANGQHAQAKFSRMGLLDSIAASVALRAIAAALRTKQPAANSSSNELVVVGWQYRLVSIKTNKIVDEWRSCSKESFDLVEGKSHQGNALRVDYRVIYAK